MPHDLIATIEGLPAFGRTAETLLRQERTVPGMPAIPGVEVFVSLGRDPDRARMISAQAAAQAHRNDLPEESERRAEGRRDQREIAARTWKSRWDASLREVKRLDGEIARGNPSALQARARAAQEALVAAESSATAHVLAQIAKDRVTAWKKLRTARSSGNSKATIEARCQIVRSLKIDDRVHAQHQHRLSVLQVPMGGFSGTEVLRQKDAIRRRVDQSVLDSHRNGI